MMSFMMSSALLNVSNAWASTTGLVLNFDTA